MNKIRLSSRAIKTKTLNLCLKKTVLCSGKAFGFIKGSGGGEGAGYKTIGLMQRVLT